MTNEQLDEIALSMAREVGEYNLLNYHEAFKLFARRLLAEAANRQEPVLMMNEVGNTEAVFKDQPQTLGFNTPLYEHPAPAVPEGWQPIETSPKTGRTILLGYFNSHGNWRTMRGQWFSQEIINEEWEDSEDCEAGWYETSVEADDVPNCWLTEPTHWMPLPAPPKGTP